MVTAKAEHATTDLDDELIMPLPIPRPLIFAIVFGTTAQLAAQPADTASDGDAGRKPLNLSLPREAVFPPGTMTRQDPTLRDNLRAPSRLDNARDKTAPDAPYGTGFEARQRGRGGRGAGSGGAGGSGFGGGGGRGGGRGR